MFIFILVGQMPCTQMVAAIHREMGQLFYNQLKNNRIKNITLGVILLVTNGLMLYVLSRSATEGNPTNSFLPLLLCFIIVGLVFLIGLIPFGQVIDSKDNEFSTYFKFGRLKFKQQKWARAENVILEQDQKRFYCLIIRTDNGKTLQIEKYPTLKEANVRLVEFNKLFTS
jgi:hypothetical protein